jgi:hypothetical protein
MSTLFDIFHSIQSSLFPWLEEELNPLTEKEQQFVRVVSLIDLKKNMTQNHWYGRGRKRKDRVSIAKAFIAKSVYNFETTDILIEYLRGCKNLRRLCGWEYSRNVPSKSTFSRAFAEFADGNLAQIIHEAMVEEHLGDKLAGHLSRDSTAIKARKTGKKREGMQRYTQKKARKTSKRRKSTTQASEKTRSSAQEIIEARS